MTGTWLSGWATGDIVTAAEYKKSAGSIFDSTLGGAAASFDFTSIPATYAHLLIVGMLRSDTVATVTSAAIRFNNDSGANYIWQELKGAITTASASNASGVTSGFLSASGVAAASAAAGVFSPVYAILPNYAAAQAHDLIGLSFFTGTPAIMGVGTHWSTAAAINRITIFSAGNWVAGSRITVYAMGS